MQREDTAARSRSLGEGLRTLVRAVAASWVGLAIACGPTVSLDASPPRASSSSGDAPVSSSADTQGTSGSTGSTQASTAADDDPIDDLPPLPGECAPGCEVDLPITWTWDDEVSDPEQWLSTMLALPDGGWVVATSLLGFPQLTKITAEGELAWSVPASLDCNCEILDLALYPSGKLAVLGQGSFDSFYQVLALGRFDLQTQDFEWKAWDTIYGTNVIPPTVGSVIPLDDVYTVMLVTEASEFSRWSSQEWIEIFVYENEYAANYVVLDSKTIDTPSPPPRGRGLSDGSVVMTLPDPNEAQSYVVWLDREDLLPFDGVLVPGVPEAMAERLDDELVMAGHLDFSSQQVILQASGVSHGEQPWVFSDGVLTTTSSAPALTVDSSGSAIVAMHATAGTPEDPRGGTVQLVRLRDGTEVWSTSIPLSLQTSSHPVAIDATVDDGLVLAGIVDGRLHLERREQTCRCD